MADTTTVQWLYPPNWDGGFAPGGGFRKYAVRLTGISDGTGETGVIKVNLSELRTPAGKKPAKSIIEKLAWNLRGYNNITLYWDRASAETIAVLSDSGELCLKKEGGQADPGDGGTGDILLSATGADLGDAYDITIWFRVK